MTRAIAAAAAAVVLSLLAAGCGGSPKSGVAHIGSTTTGKASSRDRMAQALAFATCMRSHGVPNFPDPKTNGTGGVTLSIQDTPKASSRALEIEQTLLHLKGLVFARAILEDRAASALELAEHAAELERQRRHLAELVRDFRPFLAHAHADLNRGC
jgi:hypothetical protein